MNHKKSIIGIIAALVLLTAVFTVIHLTTRSRVPEGSLAINYNGKVCYVEIDSKDLIEVRGTVVNGKGEEKEVHEQGIAVSDVLRAAGIDLTAISGVTVTADDEFSAELSADEVNEDGKAYLTDDGETMTLIVFGDSNSKRRIHNVVSLTVSR